MAESCRKYTTEMKLNAVQLVQRACDVADEFGIDQNTFYAWLSDARYGKSTANEPTRKVTHEQAENSRLRDKFSRSPQKCAFYSCANR